MKEPIDKKCIQELKQGSQDAFNHIYDTYANRLYGYCLQYTKSPEDSEELVHDLFVQLWQMRETLRDDLPLICLLFHIVRNSLINRFYARVNSPTYEAYTNYCNDKRFAEDNMLQQLEYDSFCLQLNRLKKKLPPTQQLIVENKIFGGLSNDEIAEILHLSKQTVKNQLTIALKFLRQELSTSELLIWIGILLY